MYLQIMQYTIKSRSRINRIEITVKLTNHSVLCYLKNSMKVLKNKSGAFILGIQMMPRHVLAFLKNYK